MAFIILSYQGLRFAILTFVEIPAESSLEKMVIIKGPNWEFNGLGRGDTAVYFNEPRA